ncbi:MAG TPA: hypothetical protein VGG71_04350 [Chitinophagaceae bacterium]|jgi:hypothetical protein
MARRIEKTSGKVGPVVFFNLGDKNHTRSTPKKFKQTKPTKKAALVFGNASTIGAALRPALLEGLSLAPSNDIQTRFVSAIAEWLRAKQIGQHNNKEIVLALSDFQFNKLGGEFSKRWQLPWNIQTPDEDSLQVDIPAFIPVQSIAAPAGTVSIDCMIAAAACEVGSKTFCGNAKFSFRFEHDQKEIPAKSILLEIPTPKDSLLIVAASLKYLVQINGKIKQTINKKFMPSGVVGILYRRISG